MTAPQMVGSIINAQWLADQMGLPVEEVQERLAAAERRINGEEVGPVRQAVS